MESVNKPYVVYYLPYEDERFFERSSKPQDFVCCVMAESIQHAIEKTQIIAVNNGAKFVKIMGVSNGRPEWVDETTPLRDKGRGPQFTKQK